MGIEIIFLAGIFICAIVAGIVKGIHDVRAGKVAPEKSATRSTEDKEMDHLGM